MCTEKPDPVDTLILSTERVRHDKLISFLCHDNGRVVQFLTHVTDRKSRNCLLKAVAVALRAEALPFLPKRKNGKDEAPFAFERGHVANQI